MQDLVIDGDRYKNSGNTGIYVRAKLNENWGNYDIAELDKKSLLEWLKSRGGNNPMAENTVGILLGHGHLHELSYKTEDLDGRV